MRANAVSADSIIKNRKTCFLMRQSIAEHNSNINKAAGVFSRILSYKRHQVHLLTTGPIFLPPVRRWLLGLRATPTTITDNYISER